MATKPALKATVDLTPEIKSAVTKVQHGAASAYKKGSAKIDELKSFAKGNTDAVVEATKVLSSGLKDLGTSYVADSRTATEVFASDIKELAATKSAGDLIDLQDRILRRNLDAALAFSAKNRDALISLTKAFTAPLSKRAGVVVSAVRQQA